MNELDDRIRAALVEEDREQMDRLGCEPSMLQMVAATFRGRHRGLVVLVFCSTFVFLGLGVASAAFFFQAESVRDMIMWSAALVFCLLAVMANKIWYWMELNKNAVTREVKRVELQIASLAQRLGRLDP